MQDEYFGDVNDYRKYGLLRCLSKAGFRVGVCWMHTPSDNSGQGNKIDYLEEPREYRFRDPDLFDFLKERVQAHRRAARELETASGALLRGAVFFSERLPEMPAHRDRYFERALAALRDSDFLFFDPNIGLERPSKIYGQERLNYLFWREVDTVAREHRKASIGIFQHWPRLPRHELLARLSSTLGSRIRGTRVWAIKSPDVLFLVVRRAAHRDRFTKAMERVRKKWTGDMEIVEVLDDQSP